MQRKKLLKTLLAEEPSDGGEKNEPWAIETKAVKGFEIFCRLCNVAVLDVAESCADLCAEPVGSVWQE